MSRNFLVPWRYMVPKRRRPPQPEPVEIEIYEPNAEPHLSAVVVLDASASMGSPGCNLGGQRMVRPIDELNDAFGKFPKHVAEDDILARYGELAVVRCGGGVSVLQDFLPVGQFRPPLVQAGGNTPLAESLVLASQMILDRQKYHEERDLDFHRPFVFAVTDGQPTDPERMLAEATSTIRRLETEKRVAFFVAATEGSDQGVMTQMMTRKPMPLSDYNYAGMFRWFACSMRAVTQSLPGEEVDLPSPADFGWTRV